MILYMSRMFGIEQIFLKNHLAGVRAGEIEEGFDGDFSTYFYVGY